MSELGLIVVWPNHLHLANDVVKEISKRFDIVRCYDLQWDTSRLYENFYRFYGDRLTTSSIKEKSTGEGLSKVIVFSDQNPIHEFRTNARGIEKVNSNFFDLKKAFRKKFKTRFGIHGCNDQIETQRDLCLLLGKNLEDFLAENSASWDGQFETVSRNVTGADGWESFELLFYFLNAVEPYLVLRNAEDVFALPDNDDIDFLVENPQRFAYFTNAQKMSKGTQRANYQIQVAGKLIDVDFRYVGDDYFDQYWQDDCMKKRVKNDEGVFVMDEENLYFSLAYHAFIHKREFPEKYQQFFNMPLEELMVKLYEFMYQRGYKMVEPKDITLFFNGKYGGDIRFSRDRRLRNKKGLVNGLKKLTYRLNHMLHFRRGPF